MNSYPFVSIIIPTYNRGHLLPITLDSFLLQDYPEDKYEIIISNNNSSDNTDELLSTYIKKYPNIKVHFEPLQGVHYARNNASHLARGEILYFTDDDMIADSHLLSEMVKVFINNPKVGSATGKVLPKWEIPPPVWVKRTMINGLLSLNDLGDATCVYDYDMGVFSCHQAIRRDAFFQSGGFNPENTAGKWIGDGETGLNIKIKELGYHFAYVGSSVIYHIIPPSRMTQKYLNKRMANQGNCDAFTSFRANYPSKKKLLSGFLSYILIQLLSIGLTPYKILRSRNLDPIRLSIACLHYLLYRIRYDLRLLTEKNWRKFVLQNDWLNTDDEILGNCFEN
jgi:glycosyltransferase involved in cell wall biosynthesis